MPHSLSRLFEHSRDYAVRANEGYALGESQRRAITATSRKSWRLSKRLTPDEYDDLLTFYESVGGPMVPVLFYDGSERTPIWSWDATGVSTTGRYTVVFRSKWNAEFGWPRHNVEIELMEVA